MRGDTAGPRSGLLASHVLVEEGAQVIGQDLRLVDRDQGSAAVEPNQLCVLEMFGQ